MKALVAQVLAANVPVLCVDSCAVLDVMRDVTRDTAKHSILGAGLTLLQAAEKMPTSDLTVLIAEQVSAELADNEQEVHDDARDKLAAFTARARRIDQLVDLYGNHGTLGINHFDLHVVGARSVYERWKAVSLNVSTGVDTANKAFVRVNACHAPASQGKQSMKDCVVIETYLDIVGKLRHAGFTHTVVFLSSNTNDYGRGPTAAELKIPLPSDFANVQLSFASDFGYARHILGL